MKTKCYIWWTLEHSRAMGQGEREIVKRDNGGTLTMAKEVKEIHSQATSKLGVTLNMGNFESIRVDVGVTVPCNVGDEGDATEEAYKLAETKLVEQVNRFKANFN